MKTKKLIWVSVVSVLLLGLYGCGSQASNLSVKNETNAGKVQSSSTGHTVEPQQDNGTQPGQNAISGSEPAQNNASSTKSGTGQKSPTPDSGTSLKSQQQTLSKIAAALNTKVPLMLPVNVPLTEGHYLTAMTTSETWYYKVNFYETLKPEDIGSQAASKGTHMVAVEGTEYKTAAAAKDTINGYEKVDVSEPGNPILDLGHNIKAIQDAGAGHGYITWNEGRWCIRIDSPNDPAYKNEKYPDSKQLAKNIVEYLNVNMLPAPQTIGVISVNNWNNSNGTTVEWQYNQMVYKVSSEDPMTALKFAVAMKFR